MTGRIQTRKWLRCGVAVWAVCFWMSSFAVAQDGVKLSGLWVQPVAVLGIEQGQVRYQIVSGRVLSRSVHTLEGLKLGRYPGLAEAELAVEAGDDAAAAELFREVMDRADVAWVRWFTAKRLVQAYSRLDDADAAAGIYIDMVISGAELSLVAQPPVAVVARADVADRWRVVELATAGKRTVGASRIALLDELIDAAGGAMELAPVDVLPVDGTPASEKVDGLALSTSTPPSTAGNLFRRGRYEQALRVVDEALSQPGKTASELYVKGMAQLALAEQSGDDSVYKSAGLSFMRVLVYFPRSAVAGPATVEAGYVHERIGRADIAARLYERARPLIDQREDPAYFQRLMQRIESVAETSAGE